MKTHTKTTDNRYFILHPSDPRYTKMRSKLKEIIGNPSLTVISTVVPTDRCLTSRQFIIIRYCLDRIIVGQTCMGTNNRKANADVFFSGLCLIGLEQVHAMAHLVLSYLSDFTAADGVEDRFLSGSDGRAYIVVTAELKEIDRLDQLIYELWTSFQALLNGLIEGRIAQLVFGAS